MRVDLNPCYVLHQRPFRESSLLLEIFSRDHGRLPLVHRGARRIKRGGNAVQPFQLFIFSWSGRGEIATVNRYEATGPAILLDGPACLCGLYMNELVYRLLHRHEPHQELFAVYDSCLRAFANNSIAEQQLRYFELQLLVSLGYGPILDHDSNDKPLQRQQQYYYLPELGPVVKRHGSAVALISGNTLQQLSRRAVLDKTELQEAKLLMRGLLLYHTSASSFISHDIYRQYIHAGKDATGKNYEAIAARS